MTRASRYGNVVYGTMTPDTASRGHQGAKRTPEHWLSCDADRFIQHWLPKFESVQEPRPTQAEIEATEKKIYGLEEEEEEEDDEATVLE